MSQRLLDNTKWLWCLLALHAGSFWGRSASVTVRTPPGNPATVEAQAKFFQYRHFPTSEEFNQGHRLGSERHFTERHERARPSEGLFSAKVRWGDKKGGYGEHYWDLNHAGNVGSLHDDDDGSYREGDEGAYHESDHNDPYDEPSDNSPTYGTEEYDPEKSSYEQNERAKRAHPKIKVERKHHRHSDYEEESKPQKKRKSKEELEAAATHQDEEYSEAEDDDEEEEERYEKPKPKRQKHRRQEDKQQHQHQQQHQNQQQQQPKEKQQFVLVVSQKDDSEKQKQNQQQQYQPQYTPTRQPELPQYTPARQLEPPHYSPNKHEVPQYVTYEGGAGVRQHQQPEVSAATNVPRLFLEPSTGHVVDRATGQAYVLQPIAAPKNYN